MARPVNEREACAFPGILMRFADGLRGWEIYKRCWRTLVAFFAEFSDEIKVAGNEAKGFATVCKWCESKY